MSFAAPEIHYPPSLSLAHEPLKCGQKEYLNAVNKILTRNSKNCRKIGTRVTPAGKCTLFQTENETAHGLFNTLVAIYFSHANVYTLSFAAKKEGFSDLYALFDKSIASGNISNSIQEVLTDNECTSIEAAKTTFLKEASLIEGKVPLVEVLDKQPKSKKALAQLEKSIVKTLGKERPVHAYYVLQEFIAGLTK